MRRRIHVDIDNGTLSVRGCTLSPEHAITLRTWVSTSTPWIKEIELQTDKPRSFTLAFIPDDSFWLASSADSRDMLQDFAATFLRFIGIDINETNVSLQGRTA